MEQKEPIKQPSRTYKALTGLLKVAGNIAVTIIKILKNK